MNSFYNTTTLFDEQDPSTIELEDFMRSWEDKPNTLPPLLNLVKDEPLEYELVPKKRKLDVDIVPVASVSPFSFSFSSPFFTTPLDYLFNHLLSYDQIVDTLCQYLCTQLIFNRTLFIRTVLDPNSILQSLMQRCKVMTVDIREFPGRLISNFFSWLYECLFRVEPINLPTVYCLVCGSPDHGTHDVKAHETFYGSLDQPLVESWKTKASNFYDVLKELISYLLRNPNSRQSFRTIMEKNLHCPFCSRKNGTHCAQKHQEWKAFLSIETPAQPYKEPEETDNVQNYTKSSLEYIMEQTGFQIPSFFFSLNNVQTFLDCLVTMWKSMRLFSA